MKTSEITEYQDGEEPTVKEMRAFSLRYKKHEWELLMLNDFFVKNYDKDLNMLAVAAEMILAGKTVNKRSDFIFKSK